VFNGTALDASYSDAEGAEGRGRRRNFRKFSAECLNHMALVQKPLGLLLNFNKRHIAREGLKRLVMSDTCR